MSEHEKFEQVGRLAEQYSKLKGELNHITEKINHARAAYQLVSQAMAQNGVSIGPNGSLTVMTLNNPPANLHALLNLHELTGVYGERDRLTKELGETQVRLRALAPHLV